MKIEVELTDDEVQYITAQALYHTPPYTANGTIAHKMHVAIEKQRPIQVGDKVCGDWPDAPWTVIAIDDGWAWIRSADCVRIGVMLDRLVRVQ